MILQKISGTASSLLFGGLLLISLSFTSVSANAEEGESAPANIEKSTFVPEPAATNSTDSVVKNHNEKMDEIDSEHEEEVEELEKDHQNKIEVMEQRYQEKESEIKKASELKEQRDEHQGELDADLKKKKEELDAELLQYEQELKVKQKAKNVDDLTDDELKILPEAEKQEYLKNKQQKDYKEEGIYNTNQNSYEKQIDSKTVEHQLNPSTTQEQYNNSAATKRETDFKTGGTERSDNIKKTVDEYNASAANKEAR